MASNPGALEGLKHVSAWKVSYSEITESSMNRSGVERADKGGKLKDVGEKIEWKYSLKRLAFSLLDETEIELRNIIEGRKSCFERDFMYLEIFWSLLLQRCGQGHFHSLTWQS